VAARLFWDRGFHEVTMEDIGAAAGIAGPSVYTHFAGKTDLLKTAADRIGERLRVETAEIQAAALPPGPTLARLQERFAALVIDYRDLFGAYFTEGHNLPDRDRAESRRNQRALVDYWSQVVEAACPGMAAKEARIRVHAAFAVANDLARTRKVAGRADLVSDVRVLMDAVLRGRP
jgi:AcrR family transcriptional regulator